MKIIITDEKNTLDLDNMSHESYVRPMFHKSVSRNYERNIQWIISELSG